MPTTDILTRQQSFCFLEGHGIIIMACCFKGVLWWSAQRDGLLGCFGLSCEGLGAPVVLSWGREHAVSRPMAG